MSETAREVLENARGGEVYEELRKIISEEDTIAGRTPIEWKEYFSIHLTESPGPMECIQADVKLMGLHHEATFYHNIAKLCLDTVLISSDTRFRQKFQMLYDQYKESTVRMPAASTLENLAKQETLQLDKLSSNAHRELEFWKKILTDLDMKRRLIENASTNNGIQVKMDLAGRTLNT